MLKFFDVLHPNDPEVLAKQGALGHFTSILLHDPRVLKTLGEPPDVINDPDQVSRLLNLRLGVASPLYEPTFFTLNYARTVTPRSTFVATTRWKCCNPSRRFQNT